MCLGIVRNRMCIRVYIHIRVYTIVRIHYDTSYVKLHQCQAMWLVIFTSYPVADAREHSHPNGGMREYRRGGASVGGWKAGVEKERRGFLDRVEVRKEQRKQLLKSLTQRWDMNDVSHVQTSYVTHLNAPRNTHVTNATTRRRTHQSGVLVSAETPIWFFMCICVSARARLSAGVSSVCRKFAGFHLFATCLLLYLIMYYIFLVDAALGKSIHTTLSSMRAHEVASHELLMSCRAVMLRCHFRVCMWFAAVPL